MPHPQPMTRVPSMAALFAFAAAQQTKESSVVKTGVREQHIFYVLNPDKNLTKTQQRLEKPFQEMRLGGGVVGEQPTLPKMQKVLQEMDAFMYVHSSYVNVCCILIGNYLADLEDLFRMSACIP